MRQIGTLPDPNQAARFEHILRAKGIVAEIDPDDAVVWVHDDLAVNEAREVMRRFLEQPADPEWDEAARSGRSAADAADAADRRYAQRVRAAHTAMYGADGRGWITMGLVALSVAIAGSTGLGGDSPLLRALLLTAYPAGAGLPELSSGQVWRLFTPILVHFGVTHLVFNCLNLWTWGGVVEVRKGAAFFAALVASAAAATNLSEHAWGLLTDPDSPRFVGGLSGVLYAVFGYAWFKGRIDGSDRIGVHESTVNWMLGWLLLCMTGALGNVANVAHLSGLLFGIVWAYGDVWWFRWRKRSL